MMPGEDHPAACEHCGVVHVFSYLCRYNLHGEEDSFKTSCAVCGEEIPSGADREGDKYGNLYCSHECKGKGLEMLVDTAMEASA